MEAIVLYIIFYIVGLFILFAVIEKAVQRGINNSIIGDFLKKKYGIKDVKKSFLDDDLDTDS
ncbi:hypothetical protein MHH33_12780 [Paenisporosarcina sp. FSL H8-0542]|uniref:hypothetical protein n=1 Tax=Paenisporosarcina sp. FSL H8-0542 TaxID=2921401 RepID=UPI003159F77B